MQTLVNSWSFGALDIFIHSNLRPWHPGLNISLLAAWTRRGIEPCFNQACMFQKTLFKLASNKQSVFYIELWMLNVHDVPKRPRQLWSLIYLQSQMI